MIGLGWHGMAKAFPMSSFGQDKAPGMLRLARQGTAKVFLRASFWQDKAPDVLGLALRRSLMASFG